MNEREQIIQRALQERRISAAQVPEYRRLFDAQPDLIKQLLTAKSENGGLMPGLMANVDDTADTQGYDESWLSPAERQQIAARRAPVASPAPAAPAPTHASARAPAGGDDYDESWLSPKERNRIAAAKDGTLDHGPIEFEDDSAKNAAGQGVAPR
jgi:hypothetical protein